MEKSSSLSALRQRVRDGVAESDFAGLARLLTHRGVWQAVAADPISCAYMAPVWAYGLAPAPGVDIFGRLSGWCARRWAPIMPWAFCMRTGFACPGMHWPAPFGVRAGRRSIRRWAALPVGGCFRPLHRTPCWPHFRRWARLIRLSTAGE